MRITQFCFWQSKVWNRLSVFAWNRLGFSWPNLPFLHRDSKWENFFPYLDWSSPAEGMEEGIQPFPLHSFPKPKTVLWCYLPHCGAASTLNAACSTSLRLIVPWNVLSQENGVGGKAEFPPPSPYPLWSQFVCREGKLGWENSDLTYVETDSLVWAWKGLYRF